MQRPAQHLERPMDPLRKVLQTEGCYHCSLKSLAGCPSCLLTLARHQCLNCLMDRSATCPAGHTASPVLENFLWICTAIDTAPALQYGLLDVPTSSCNVGISTTPGADTAARATCLDKVMWRKAYLQMIGKKCRFFNVHASHYMLHLHCIAPFAGYSIHTNASQHNSA